MHDSATRSHRLLVPSLTSLATAVSIATLALPTGACSSSASSGETAGAAVSQADTPTLVQSLAVSPLALSPAFSSRVHDYVVPCAAGANPLSLTAQTATGTTLTVILPTTTVQVTDGGSLDMVLSEDDPVIVEAQRDGAHESYWLRCLPHDFPALSFVPHPSAGTRTPGWYLMGDVFLSAGESGFAMILDDQGTPVWYQRVSTTNGVMNLDWQPNGTLTYMRQVDTYGDDPTVNQTMQTLTPWVTRSIATVGSPTDEHELHMLPNGDVMTFTYAPTGGFDLTGLSTFGTDETIADCTVQEIDPTGAVVWTWRASDHIDPVKESLNPLVNVIGGVNVVDVYHLNSIDEDASGNLLVSSRATSAVYYVNKTTGAVQWKLGGAAYSKDGAQLLTLVGDPGTTFDSQHDARFQPNGVSLFDDHSNLPGVARGVQYDIDLTAGTATFVWQYASTVVSQAMGSFRRYPDGSNLICWGLAANTAADVTEVDDSGNDLLDISFANAADSSYRAVKVPTDTFDANVLRATAGHP